MDTEVLLSQVRALADPLLAAREIELVELSCRRQGPQPVVRLLVQAPGGITLGQCAELNRILSAALDQTDVSPEAYTLEVASPGLDRPLTTRRDFERVIGQQIRADLREPVLGHRQCIGRVIAADDTSVTVETKQWGQVTFPLTGVARAVIHLPW